MTAFAQGEIYVRSVNTVPEGLTPFAGRDHAGRWIVSHSEKGHHHLLDADGVEVLERTKDVPDGMSILYAIVKEPTKLWQDASGPHGLHDMPPGIYELRISREHDPLMEQARRVTD